MRNAWNGLRAVALAGLVLAVATGLGAQSTGQSATTSSTPVAQPAPGTMPVSGDTAKTAGTQQQPATTPAAQPAPGTAPVGGDTPASDPTKPPAP